jgi:hypothetical protein
MFGRQRLAAEEFREVMREDALRFERALRAFSADSRRHLEAQREETRRYFEIIDGKVSKLDAKTEEIIAEGRAGREALFKILDRLDNGGPATAG